MHLSQVSVDLSRTPDYLQAGLEMASAGVLAVLFRTGVSVARGHDKAERIRLWKPTAAPVEATAATAMPIGSRRALTGSPGTGSSPAGPAARRGPRSR